MIIYFLLSLTQILIYEIYYAWFIYCSKGFN